MSERWLTAANRQQVTSLHLKRSSVFTLFDCDYSLSQHFTSSHCRLLIIEQLRSDWPPCGFPINGRTRLKPKPELEHSDTLSFLCFQLLLVCVCIWFWNHAQCSNKKLAAKYLVLQTLVWRAFIMKGWQDPVDSLHGKQVLQTSAIVIWDDDRLGVLVYSIKHWKNDRVKWGDEKSGCHQGQY